MRWPIGFLVALTLQTTFCFFELKADGLNDWIVFEQRRSAELLMRNISPAGAAPGAVIASPQKDNPNYFYHWVRDAAITMDVLVSIYSTTSRQDVKQRLFNVLDAYINFSRKNQTTPTRSRGLGEPKFEADGRAFEGDWGRPQNDGPALRALSLTHLANRLLKEDQADYVRGKLYDSFSPSETVIKNDLDFVAIHWNDPSYDLWEEVKGDHFFTRLVQRRALMEGAKLAGKLDDPDSAMVYQEAAKALTTNLLTFWNPETVRIAATKNRIEGIDYKDSQLDVAEILAAIRADGDDHFFSATDDRMLATFVQIRNAFQQIYTINHQEELPGTAVGRYPEDRFDGTATKKAGNPWFIATFAMGEYCYKAANEWKERGALKISELNLPFFTGILPGEDFQVDQVIRSTDPLFSKIISGVVRFGDTFLARAATHLNRQTGSISEQFNRETGFMQSARDLTWSYAEFLTSAEARSKVISFAN